MTDKLNPSHPSHPGPKAEPMPHGPANMPRGPEPSGEPKSAPRTEPKSPKAPEPKKTA